MYSWVMKTHYDQQGAVEVSCRELAINWQPTKMENDRAMRLHIRWENCGYIPSCDISMKSFAL